MKHVIFKCFASLVPAAMLAACVNHPYEGPTLEEKVAQLGFTIGQPVERIINFQIRSWNDVDHKNVILSVGASRNYLVTLRASCDGLESATTLNFTTTVGSLTDRDKLQVRNASHHLSQCFIKSINELEKIEASDRQKRSGAGVTQ